MSALKRKDVMTVKTMVLRAAGTNCDMETAEAFQRAGAEVRSVHINALVRGESHLEEVHILAIPGGFTYGDDIAAGRILANELRHNLTTSIQGFTEEGRLVLGICNGFQVLVKAGLLPNLNEEGEKQQVTLGWNDSGRYEDRWVFLKRELNSPCVFTRDLKEIIYIPVAHAEGKFVPRDKNVLRRLEENGQIVFRYANEQGEPAGYPWNPNGSVGHVAGLCDPTGRIFGLMPHPERHMLPTQHPRWTWQRYRGELGEKGDGMAIFENAVRYVREHL